MQPVSTWLASACLFPTRECSARHFHGADLSARSCFQTIRDRCLVPKSVTNQLDEYNPSPDSCLSAILNGFPLQNMEPRAQQYHRDRLGEAIREEIETILEGEL